MVAKRSHQTIEFLRTPVPNFVEAENWPLKNSDLNSMDYSIWGALHHVYRRHIRDIDRLKELISAYCEQTDDDLIEKSCQNLSQNAIFPRFT